MSELAKTLSGRSCPEPEETHIAERNLASYERLGWCVRRGWDRKAPYVEFVEGGHGAHHIRREHHFLDHLYRLIVPNAERGPHTVYAAEPYRLYDDDLIALAGLVGDGWRVSIADVPLWYPGRTTPVLIEKDGESA